MAPPWCLLSTGILILVIGYVLAAVKKPPRAERPRIDPRMGDDEIIDRLHSRQGSGFSPNHVVVVGIVVILVGLVWRFVPFFFWLLR